MVCLNSILLLCFSLIKATGRLDKEALTVLVLPFVHFCNSQEGGCKFILVVLFKHIKAIFNGPGVYDCSFHCHETVSSAGAVL